MNELLLNEILEKSKEFNAFLNKIIVDHNINECELSKSDIENEDELKMFWKLFDVCNQLFFLSLAVKNYYEKTYPTAYVKAYGYPNKQNI